MFATAVLTVLLAAPGTITATTDDEKMVGHMVYFTLKDRTAEGRDALAASCTKFLEDIDGIVFFAAGTLPETGFDQPGLNDRDWDVALQVVFKNKQAHDTYATHPEHLAFIEANKESWAKVRVFDSVFRAGKKTGTK